MGMYKNLLEKIKTNVSSNDFSRAKNNLKILVSFLKEDFKKSKNPNERASIEKAARRLVSVYKELESGTLSDSSYYILGLQNPLDNKQNEVSLDDLTFSDFSLDEPVKEEIPVPIVAPISDETDTVSNTNEDNSKKSVNKIKASKKPLCPLTFADYIGQEKAKKVLKIMIGAAKKEKRVLPHLLINSGYGLGKTTLANIIANEMELPFFEVNATNLKDPKSLSLYFSKIDEPCIIFIDEIHTLKKEVQTVLLSIMVDYHVSLIDDSGVDHSFDVPPFTLIGATTQAGELLKPFINRFTLIELLDYTTEEKTILVKSKLDKLKLKYDDDAVKDIALRSRGVPRTMEIYAKGIKDYCLSMEVDEVTKEITNDYFELNDIDLNGLINNDIKVLKALSTSEKPQALITIESKTGIQKEDIEFRYEPFLIQNGLMEKTERGRIITKKGLDYLCKPFSLWNDEVSSLKEENNVITDKEKSDEEKGE